MNINSLSLANIGDSLNLVSQRRGTGELLLTTPDRQWQLYFFHGRLLFATSNFHRVRRWQRVLKQYSANFRHRECCGEECCWEYSLLGQAIATNQITLHQAKGIIQTSILEVFFDLVSHPTPLSSRWQNSKPSSTQIALLEAEQIFQKSQGFWQQWQAGDFGHLSPSLSPTLKYPYQTKNEESRDIVSLIDGENTLWDIAYQSRRSVISIASCLFYLSNKGIVELKYLPDLEASNFKSETAPVKSTIARLIACIDDSPLIGKTLEKIVLPAGYRLLNITEPLKQMALLVKERPELIFLDLVMPDTSGYSLCTFLRKTPIFQKTPIIILTSRDNIINRGHAKLTGATDFLSKPPDSQKVLQTVHKYLAKPDEKYASDRETCINASC